MKILLRLSLVFAGLALVAVGFLWKNKETPKATAPKVEAKEVETSLSEKEPAKETRAPGAYCEYPVFNAGRVPVKNGECVLQHVFTIKNDSPVELKFTEYAPSCNCLEIFAPKDILPANGSIEVTAVMRFGQDKLEHRFVEGALVFNGNRENPVKVSILTAAELQPYLSSAKLDFGTFYHGRSAQREFSIFWPDLVERKEILKSVELDKDFPKHNLQRVLRPTVAIKNSVENFHIAEEVCSLEITPEKVGKFETSLNYVLADGRTRMQKILYEVLPADCFIPEIYFHDAKDTESSFSVSYVSDVNDPPAEFYSATPAFRVEKTSDLHEKINIEIRAIPAVASSPAEASAICIKKKSGKIVQMPVHIQK